MAWFHLAFFVIMLLVIVVAYHQISDGLASCFTKL